MLRILAFLLIVLAAALGFGWLADNPGTVTFVWQGSQVSTSMMVFLIVLGVLLFAVVLLVWLVRAFFKTPGAVGSWWRTRRRDKGYRALSNGIIAAGAGDAMVARRMTKRSEKLLDTRKEPLIRFLDAQTAMIEGDHERARSAFEQMERDPETRLLALRGLFLEAERVGDEGAARYYAERAVRIAPHVPWAGGAVLETKSLAGDWDGALEILDAQKNSRLIGRDESKRLKAVLLTAKAMTKVDAEPAVAKSAGVEAHKLAPDLTPATLVAAEAMFRLGDTRRGAKILEQGFRSRPHPDIAEAYVRARSGDTAEDRLKRAQKLQSMAEGQVDAEMCLARAALDAGDRTLARKAAMAAVAAEPRESGYLLLADIEEEDTGAVGRVREWLAKAIRAPRDPAWTADGLVSRTWAPISPVTGRLDAFQWKVPVEHVSGEEAPLIEGEEATSATSIEKSDEPRDGKRLAAALDRDSGTAEKAQSPSSQDEGSDADGRSKPEHKDEGEAKAETSRDEPDEEPRRRGIFERSRSLDKKPHGSPDDSSATTSQERGFGPASDERKEARFG